MRVLLSGGKKTNNILNAILKKFEASGDEFIVVEYLDDIEDIFSRGDYYDKALITEQSITRDYTITDETEIRHRINQFALTSSAKTKKYSYVFLTQYEPIATMIFEEILTISNDSAVVLKTPPYAVTFFVDLIVNDVKRISPDYMFTPVYTNDDADLNAVPNDDLPDDDLKDVELHENTDIPAAPDDFDKEIFGSNIAELTDNVDVSDELNVSAGDASDDSIALAKSEEEERNRIIREEEEKNDHTNEIPDIQVSDEDLLNFDPSEMGGITDTDEDSSGDIPVDETVQAQAESADIPDFVNSEDADWGNEQEDIGVGIESQPEQEENSNINTDEIVIDPNRKVDFIPGLDDDDSINGDNTTDLYTGVDSNESKFDAQDKTEFDINTIPEAMNPDSTGEQIDDIQEEQPGVNIDNSQQAFNITPEMQAQLYNAQFNPQIMSNTPPIENIQAPYNTPEPEQMQYNNQMYDNQQMMQPEQPMMQPYDGDTNIDTGSDNAAFAGIFKGKGKNKKQPSKKQKQPRYDINKIRASIKPFADRGNSIIVTGCGGCGTSTIAYNLANIIEQLGYTVLLVDMDINGKSQSYLSKAEYEHVDFESANLISAVNTTKNVKEQEVVVKEGFHVLTVGLGADSTKISETLQKEKLQRFASVIKSAHNFVIYDVPFEVATGFLADITYTADNIVFTVDASNWGVTKAMLNMCNIDNEDMQDIMFGRAQVVFNKYRNMNRVFGVPVHSCTDILKEMDKQLIQIVGDDIGLHFSELSVPAIVDDDHDFEAGWYEEVQYSDTAKGQNIFLKMLVNIVLKQ